MEKIDLWPGRDTGEFRPYLEVNLLPGKEIRGAVVVCPGGGYRKRAAHEGAPVAETFAAMGFHTFVLQYRVHPTRFPEPQQDALRAIRIVRAHAAEWNVAPDKIAILGFSSGGHLAMSACTYYGLIDSAAGDAADQVSDRPDAGILCYPVIDVDGNRHGHVGSGIELCGGKIPTQEELYLYSLQFHVRADMPPCFFWHTAEDRSVPVMNSIAMAQAMWNRRLTAELHIFPHGNHGLGLAPDFPDIAKWPQLASQFLHQLWHK